MTEIVDIEDIVVEQSIDDKLNQLSPQEMVTIMTNYTLIKGKDILSIITMIGEDCIEESDTGLMMSRLKDRMNIDLDKLIDRRSMARPPLSTNPMPQYGRIDGIPAKMVDMVVPASEVLKSIE